MATPVHDNGILGEGQVVAVLDTGLDADTCYFRDDVAGPPPTVVGFGTGTPDPSQRKVLIVEDDRHIGKVEAAMLEGRQHRDLDMRM